MILNRVETKAKLLSDLFAGEVFRDQLVDPPLARRELFQTWILYSQSVAAHVALQQKGGQRRANKRVSHRNRVDAVEKILSGVFFQHIAQKAGVDGLIEQTLLFKHG